MDQQVWRSLVALPLWDSQIWDGGMHTLVQNNVYFKPDLNVYFKPDLFSASLTKLFMVTWVGERIYLTCETPEGLRDEAVQCSCLLIGPGTGKWFEERAIKHGWRAELEFCSRVLCSSVAEREGLRCRDVWKTLVRKFVMHTVVGLWLGWRLRGWVGTWR